MNWFLVNWPKPFHTEGCQSLLEMDIYINVRVIYYTGAVLLNSGIKCLVKSRCSEYTYSVICGSFYRTKEADHINCNQLAFFILF